MPVIALAAMAPAAAASGPGILNIVADGPTSGSSGGSPVTWWNVTVQNLSGTDIASGDLKITVPKGSDYRIADNSTFPWVKTDIGSAFLYTYNAKVFGGSAAPQFRFEFFRPPPASTTPTVTITASATGYDPVSKGLIVTF